MHPRFDALYAKLVLRGVSRGYAERVAEELEDHFAESVGELVSGGFSPAEAEVRARKRIGDDDSIVTSVIADRRALVFPVRAPLTTFFVGPIVACAVLSAVCLIPALTVVACSAVLMELSLMDPAACEFGRLAYAVTTCVASSAAAIVFWRIARRHRLSTGWAWLACLTMAIFGGLFYVYVPIH